MHGHEKEWNKRKNTKIAHIFFVKRKANFLTFFNFLISIFDRFKREGGGSNGTGF